MAANNAQKSHLPCHDAPGVWVRVPAAFAGPAIAVPIATPPPQQVVADGLALALVAAAAAVGPCHRSGHGLVRALYHVPVSDPSSFKSANKQTNKNNNY